MPYFAKPCEKRWKCSKLSTDRLIVAALMPRLTDLVSHRNTFYRSHTTYQKDKYGVNE